MSLEALITELNANLRDLNVNLVALAGLSKKSPAPTVAQQHLAEITQTKATGAEPATPAPAPAPADTAAPLEYKTVADAFLNLIKVKGRPAGVEVLAQFGLGESLKAAKPEQYADILAAIEAKVAA